MAVSREGLKKHEKIIQLWLDGNELQYKSRYAKDWKDVLRPTFDVDAEYRVKPAKEFVPFTFADRDQFRGKWIRRKTDGAEFCPSEIYQGSVYFQAGNYATYEQLTEKFEFLDGTPIGKWVFNNISK